MSTPSEPGPLSPPPATASTPRWQVPHTLVLLSGMLVMAWVLTLILPQGAFETSLNDHGREEVVADTFTTVEDRVWIGPQRLFTILPEAFAAAQDIIFFVLLIGGVMGVLRASGALDAFLGWMLRRASGRPRLLVGAALTAFAVGSSTLGMAEEYIPLVGLLVGLCAALGYDRITAVGAMVAGYGIGYGVAAVNPFTVLVAQEVAGLAPTSGFAFRMAIFLPFLAIGLHHVLSRARRVPVADPAATSEHHYPAWRVAHGWILLLLVATLGLIVWGISGASGWGWYLSEISAAFLALSVGAAIIARLGFDGWARAFSDGATQLTVTALLIGFARAIALMLEEGQVLHTIVHGLSQPLGALGSYGSAMGMLVFQSLLNFFIPSGSGQAYVTMPLMAPLADLTGISRQVAVLAYQFGDGLTNMIVPTNAVLMGILGIAGISYGDWFRYIAPLVLKLLAAAALAMALAVWLGLQ